MTSIPMLTSLISKHWTFVNYERFLSNVPNMKSKKVPLINMQIQCYSNTQCDFSMKRSLSHSYTSSKLMNKDNNHLLENQPSYHT